MDFQAHSNCKTGVGSCRLLLHASCFYHLTFRKYGMAWESGVVSASILEALHSVRLSWGNKNLLARLVKKSLSAKRSHFLTIVPDPLPLNCLRSSCTVDPTCADGAHFQHSRKVKSHVLLPRRCSLPSQTSPKRPHALSHLAIYLSQYQNKLFHRVHLSPTRHPPSDQYVLPSFTNSSNHHLGHTGGLESSLSSTRFRR